MILRNTTIKYKTCLSLMAVLCILACQRGEDLPLLEIQEHAYYLYPSTHVIDFNNIILEIPNGTVDDTTAVVFTYTDVCDAGIESAHFFRCPAITIHPANLTFNIPVRMTISQGIQWQVNEYGHRLQRNLDKISVFEISDDLSSAKEIEGCNTTMVEEEIFISCDIKNTGIYQIGIREEFYYYDRGFVKDWLYRETDTLQFTIHTGNRYAGAALFEQNFLDNGLFILLHAVDIVSGSSYNLKFPALGYGTHRFSGSEYTLISMYYEFPATFGVIMNETDTASIAISRFDENRIEGTVEGTVILVDNPADSIYRVKSRTEFSIPMEN